MHVGIDHVRNFIQQTHYIFRLRTILRSISFTCFKCRRFRGQGLQPYMSSLSSYFRGSNSPAQSSWRRSQDYSSSLWQRLLHEITPQMIGRPKWNKHDTQLKEDLVWILNDNCPRGVWPLGIVEKTHIGPDGVVRSCLLKTALAKVTRPAVRLSLVHPKNIPPQN